MIDSLLLFFDHEVDVLQIYINQLISKNHFSLCPELDWCSALESKTRLSLTQGSTLLNVSGVPPFQSKTRIWFKNRKINFPINYSRDQSLYHLGKKIPHWNQCVFERWRKHTSSQSNPYMIARICVHLFVNSVNIPLCFVLLGFFSFPSKDKVHHMVPCVLCYVMMIHPKR